MRFTYHSGEGSNGSLEYNPCGRERGKEGERERERCI